MKRAILLIDHGSRRAEANRLLEAVAERLRRRAPEHIVAVAHMELAAPSLAEGIAACVDQGAESVVVHPYFLGPGRHTRSDIPALVRAAAERHPGLPIRISEPLGLDERLVEVVLDRVRAVEDPA